MNRQTFLTCFFGGGIAAPLLAQPPSKEENEKAVLQKITKLDVEIKALKEKEGNETKAVVQALLQLRLGDAYSLRGSYWRELEEWQAALLEFSDARRYHQQADDYLSRTNPSQPPSRHAWVEATLHYAEMKWKLGYFQDALEYAKTARAKNYRTDEADYLLAQAYAALEDFPKARECALACLTTRLPSQTKFPQKTANAARLIGAVAYLQGDLTEAKARWEEAGKIDGRFTDVDPFDPNQAPLNAAIAKNPKDFAARMARVLYFRARASYQVEEIRIRTKPAESVTVKELLLVKQSVSALQGGWINLLELKSTQPYSFEQAALLDLEVAQSLQPKSAMVHWEYFIARSQYEKKYPKLRVKEGVIRQHHNLSFLLATHYAKQSSAADVLYDIGAFFIRVESTPALTVVRYLSQGLLLAPTHPFAATARALREEAVKQVPGKLVEAPAGTPKTALEWKERGNLHSSGGDWKNALMCYEKALAVDPKFADAYNNIGNVYSTIGCYDRAVEALGRALDSAPKHKLAYLNRARIWFDVGSYEKAHDDAEKALANALTPDAKASACTIKADSLLQRFRAQEALSAATEALVQDGTHKMAWQVRGIAELYLGRPASSSFEKAEDTLYVQLLRCLAVVLEAPEGANSYSVKQEKGGWTRLEKEAKPNDFDRVMLFIHLWQESTIAPPSNSTLARRLGSFYHDIFIARNPES
jgi:tetratricopeptide (TPR) repeat protein